MSPTNAADIATPPTAREIAPIPSQRKAPSLYLIAVIVLGVVSTASVVLIGALAFAKVPIPTELGSLGLVAISAIAGMVYVSKTA
jgi:hypothetical protein